MGKNIQREPRESKRWQKHLRHSEYTIYTDGSKKQEGTGGGFVVYNYNKQIHTQSFKMQDHATVYQLSLIHI